MEYKYFLFDWDGSLANTLPLWFETFRKVFGEYGVSISDMEIGKDIIGVVDGPAKFGITNLDEFRERTEELTLEKLTKVELNGGAKNLIEKIKSHGGKVAIVTTSRRVYVEQAIRNNGIWDMVDVFLGKEDVTKYKPDPEILIKALVMMDGEIEKAIMTGDTEKDIFAAKNAGIKSVLYYPDRYKEYYDKVRQESFGANKIISSFVEMEELLR